jgi:hypothetical protein
MLSVQGMDRLLPVAEMEEADARVAVVTGG